MSPLSISLIVMLCLLIASMVIWVWKVLNWVWIRPKKIEKRLRAQGLAGNPYRLLYEDTNDMAAMIKEAKSKPIKLSDDVVPRVLPLRHHIINKYVARVLIMEPELLKKILINNHIFKKPTHNPLAQFLVCGLAGYEDEKWAKHRRIINFYVENLKLRGIINKREESMRKGECADDDLLGILLKSNEREIRENDGSSSAGMSIEEVVEECKTFYLSGQESTSNLLSWTMMLLEQARGFCRVLLVLVLFRVVDLLRTFMNSLMLCRVLLWLTMILYEVLRLYPPAIIFNRILENETELGNMRLPGGVYVLLPIILIHRDKQLWGEDVDEFKGKIFRRDCQSNTESALLLPLQLGP
ncbi:hypothetical protein SASPL_146306 [Salvia splendens]|uniref:Uncharacterized protein n=1 Tax=Salvia splendens TaxID=180675 RepID=A0A8X8Z4S2_SALSN|nr:hypothetical protein SASPL_146306 [Salvia splendens]